MSDEQAASLQSVRGGSCGYLYMWVSLEDWADVVASSGLGSAPIKLLGQSVRLNRAKSTN